MGRKVLYAMVSLGFIVSMFGCAAKKQAIKPEEEPISLDEPDIRSGEYQSDMSLASIYFDYDESSLRSDAKAVLKKNADYLKENTDIEVLVEGHCDERGTLEYNMALGQRRAEAVRDYVSKLGISLGRISTISYGEEKPAAPGNNEAAWAKNRRAEFKVRKAASK